MAKGENETHKIYRFTLYQLRERETYEVLLSFDKNTDPEEICLIRERSFPDEQTVLSDNVAINSIQFYINSILPNVANFELEQISSYEDT